GSGAVLRYKPANCRVRSVNDHWIWEGVFLWVRRARSFCSSVRPFRHYACHGIASPFGPTGASGPGTLWPMAHSGSGAELHAGCKPLGSRWWARRWGSDRSGWIARTAEHAPRAFLESTRRNRDRRYAVCVLARLPLLPLSDESDEQYLKQRNFGTSSVTNSSWHNSSCFAG